ncbi:MAG: galactose-1-phosphate uridylyltransferase [Arthrobacter sp.]|uniref:galactose-1-phosphate uridylyltransferase n=1 Tax=unclassified Arthrobacter TaxID=235627 RepID=UPI0026554079|nr:galactose-1-phosphate uridylyltransferase [Micrococcaceae bacterium]MDN5811987.1 galactose-1-phosphate uridylyltransferase [Micrococcaceae bacterium]MDN5825145.1 galactose-1-phosphate uridylyltransferase [Micrococcaceae bacterium]MDN5879058.1 galactose-1-phosphate uridylyltransferase [Micrococcaceae bacterium]MDN5886397.1 galactose-1-phosphate uridylyltransferase [Micrococcaceae bacterium]
MNSPTETAGADALRQPVRARMADGRELLYFFDHPGQHEDFVPPADLRELPERPSPARLRRDPLTGEWVSFAAHRQGRTHLPPADECPLCPSGPERSTEVAAAQYDVVVFENRFPSFGPGQQEQQRSEAMGETYPAEGRCEVIAFGADHGDSFADLDVPRARTVVDAWAQRTAELSALPGVEQVFAFENRGAQIGVTLHHPHGQIYSYPYVTPRTLTQLDQAQRHREETGRNLMQDVLDFEVAAGTRIVERTEYFTVFVPFAARMPVEVHVVPNRHVADLAGLTARERSDLADVYLRLLRGVDALYATPTPYIAAWFQAPVRHPAAGELRLHLQLTSPRRAEEKLKYLAGSEAAMGAFIADVTPETTAARLRAALATPTGASA